jgi:predicted ArsR family transcriptional regulator
LDAPDTIETLSVDPNNPNSVKGEEHRKRIFAELMTGGPQTTKEVAAKIGLQQEGVYNQLINLQRLGKVSRTKHQPGIGRQWKAVF